MSKAVYIDDDRRRLNVPPRVYERMINKATGILMCLDGTEDPEYVYECISDCVADVLYDEEIDCNVSNVTGLIINSLFDMFPSEFPHSLIEYIGSGAIKSYSDRRRGFVCPRCGRLTTGFPALSRRDNRTEICSECGQREAIEDWGRYVAERRSGR